MPKADIRPVIHEGTDFIIVKDLELFTALRTHAPKSLVHKTIIYAPGGIEFLKVEDLIQLPQLRPYLKDGEHV
jgi:hypothetical protein